MFFGTSMADVVFELKRDIQADFASVRSLMIFNNELKQLYFCKCVIKPKFSWIDGSMFSILSAILRQRIEKNGLRIVFDFSESKPAIKELFLRNGFFEESEIVDKNNTLVPVKAFDRTQIESFIQYVVENFDNNKFPFPRTFALSTIVCLAEIFSNCEIHSQTRRVFTAGQFFPNKSDRGEFAFCLTDLGIGIVTLVKKEVNNHFSSEDAIRWAFTKSNTTRSDRPGGLGLNTLRENTARHGGHLLVVSNDIVYDALEDKCDKLPFAFDGTSVILKLVC